LIHKTWISVSAAFSASAEGMEDHFPGPPTDPYATGVDRRPTCVTHLTP